MLNNPGSALRTYRGLLILEKKLAMTPKKFCYLTIMLISNLASHAQDRRTLEISETDTVFLKPISIVYSG